MSPFLASNKRTSPDNIVELNFRRTSAIVASRDRSRHPAAVWQARERHEAFRAPKYQRSAYLSLLSLPLDLGSLKPITAVKVDCVVCMAPLTPPW
ncbi:hypothetical protein CTA2_2081 [Colletotrichum tanaceti]|nr:hypothetical protein CTA2_2081 [Colletotrichum tanaceti]